MAGPTSRDTLIDYCLRRLGAPVIDINVDLDQLEDKVDDALQVYQEYHSDATLKTYRTHQVTQDDIDNDYISLGSDVLYVTRLFPPVSTFTGTRNFFDVRYQMMLNDATNLYSIMGNIAVYDQLMQYLNLLDMKLNGEPLVQFNRHQHKLHIFGDFNDNNTSNFKVGDYAVYECYVVLDPASHTGIYNDMFIKDYTTALIKQQWGANMMKFEGVQLPGGVMFNGRQYYDDATADLTELRERLRLEQEMPIDFLVG